MQPRRPGAPMDDSMETSMEVQMQSAGDFQKSRQDQYFEDPDDWANRWWYQTGIHLGMIYDFGLAVLAIAELIKQSPAQIAYDYINFPNDYYMFNTFFGLTPWLILVTIGGWIAFSWFLTAMGRGCANRMASKYNRTASKGDKVSLPYPPLRVTGWWCFWNLVFWAGAVGWAGKIFWQGTNINIVQQYGQFVYLWWYTIICAMFTCLPGILHRFRHAADSWMFACGSTWFDC